MKEEMKERIRRVQKGIGERMVEAVIATEEECKEVRSSTRRSTEPTHSNIAPQLSAA